ncbi:MAG: transcriptional regulator [Moraxellaceae bacterium]|nr:MAG: transcriptional regulator [Moraxellaceae bacterium]
MSNDQPNVDASLPFGRLLRFWRGVHRVSQEELASRLNSASRHISRLENGKAYPGKDMVVNIAKVLTLGERDTNHLLYSAGYTPIQKKIDFHAPELKWLRKAMTLTLRALDPFPTTLMDSSTNILMVNKGWVGLFQEGMASEEGVGITNHFDFLFRQMGASQEFENTISLILMSLQQTVLLTGDSERKETLEQLLSSPFVPTDWKQRAAKLEPMTSYRVQAKFNGKQTTFFSVSQTVGALGPNNAFVSEPNLTVTTFYPEDEGLDLSFLVAGELTHPLLFY